MLQQVALELPELYDFCHAAYSEPSSLLFGDRIISSEVGPQQGDPLGGILFCLGLHPTLSACQSPLIIGYMDDVTLGGPPDTVYRDVERFRSEGSNIGLSLSTP